MSNAFDIVLVSPFTPRDLAVVAGMAELGFSPGIDTGGSQPRPEYSVWTRLSLKLPYIDGQAVGLEGLCRAVAALPWAGEPRQWDQPWHLRVLWKDEHTMEDDSWGGRVSPFAWHVETWDVTTKAEVPQ